jgi:fatty acid desaturase
MYLIPAGLAGFMQSLRKYIEHMGLTGATVLSSTRSVVNPGLLGRLLAFTLFQEPYHGVHHKLPRLPQAALPEFSDDLVPGDPTEHVPFPTYRQALFDMLPTLLDPRVGSQWLALGQRMGQHQPLRLSGKCLSQGEFKESSQSCD